MIELYAYRHKTHKDCWLERNCVCRGGASTQCYTVTNLLYDAIRNVSLRDSRDEEGFEGALRTTRGEPTLVEFDISKFIEFDGYSGNLKKHIKCTTADFEKVVFREVCDAE